MWNWTPELCDVGRMLSSSWRQMFLHLSPPNAVYFSIITVMGMKSFSGTSPWMAEMDAASDSPFGRKKQTKQKCLWAVRTNPGKTADSQSLWKHSWTVEPSYKRELWILQRQTFISCVQTCQKVDPGCLLYSWKSKKTSTVEINAAPTDSFCKQWRCYYYSVSATAWRLLVKKKKMWILKNKQSFLKWWKCYRRRLLSGWTSLKVGRIHAYSGVESCIDMAGLFPWPCHVTDDLMTGSAGQTADGRSLRAGFGTGWASTRPNTLPSILRHSHNHPFDCATAVVCVLFPCHRPWGLSHFDLNPTAWKV